MTNEINIVDRPYPAAKNTGGTIRGPVPNITLIIVENPSV
jgi:hypothetical protein